MARFLDAIGDAVHRTACAIISANDVVNGFLLDVGLPGAQEYSNRTRALRRQLCDNDDDDVTIPTSPFTGGQCSTNYRVFISLFRASDGLQVLGPEHPAGNRTQNANNVWPGPISGISIIRNPTNSTQWGWAIDCAAGTIFGYFANMSNDFTVSIDRVERIDGLADDCGSIDSPIPPYVPAPTTVNISYQNNQEIVVNEDVDITIFSPQVNLIGGIFAPITISGNTFQLVGTVQLSPEFKLEISPEINIGGGSNRGVDTDPPEPVTPVDRPLDSDDRRVIVGAIVTTTALQTGSPDSIPQAENPDIFIPRLGSVSFLIATDKAVAWTNDIDVKSVRAYIPCKVPGGAIDVKGTPVSGVSLDVSPVWGYPQGGQV